MRDRGYPSISDDRFPARIAHRAGSYSVDSHERTLCAIAGARMPWRSRFPARIAHRVGSCSADSQARTLCVIAESTVPRDVLSGAQGPRRSSPSHAG